VPTTRGTRRAGSHSLSWGSDVLSPVPHGGISTVSWARTEVSSQGKGASEEAMEGP
jgi:hypothetical protein